MSTEANQPASDISQMSDEEILNMPPPEVTQNNSETQEGSNDKVTPDDSNEQDDDVPELETDNQEKEDELDNVEDANESNTTQVETNDGKVAESESNDAADTSEGKDNPSDPEKEKDESTPKEEAKVDFDYKAGYEAIMAPFKANGKLVQARSPEEAIALMQQGANFTRKMQEIAPYRKLIHMLQTNDLMDEGQLSFAIDLVKRNPDAIKKLVKDAGIDPMDIDTNEEIKYREGNHRVSDAEVRFSTELGDLRSSPEGNTTLGVIHQTWDDASKQALYETAGLVNTIHEQRESGIYDRIAAEIEHLRTIGKIGANVPFIQAYKSVGDYLMQNGGFDDLKAKQIGAAPAVAASADAKPLNSPVATRVVTPKPAVTNGERASAASSSRSAPRKAEAIVNFLDMSDADFLKLPAPKSA